MDANEPETQTHRSGDLTETLRLVTRLDYFATVVFLLLWIVPVTIVGLTSRPVSRQFHFAWLQNIGCLFTGRQALVQVFTLEALPEGTPAHPSPADWINLGIHPDYAPMDPFGQRSRLGWRIEDIYRYSGAYVANSPPWLRAKAQEQEMYEWARKRYAELNPERPGLRALRLIGARYIVEEHLANPRGRWTRTDFATFPDERKFLVGSIVYESVAPEPDVPEGE